MTKPQHQAPEELSGAFSEILWTLRVPPEAAGQRLDRFLRQTLGLGRRYIAHLKFHPDGLLLDGERVTADRPLRGSETLRLSVGDGAGNPARAIEAPFALLWEDEYLAVLNKAAGIAVHGPDREGLPPTLQNAAAFHWGVAVPFHPVQRLDRGTSGLMLLGKCRLAHERLQKQLHSERLEREYLALVQGCPAKPTGRIELPLAPEGGRSCRRIVRADGQRAQTDYEVLAEAEGASLLRLRLWSGRSHQIRAHCAALGCPLLGDALYGGSALEDLSRPALHSHKLRFFHPFRSETLAFTAPPPADFSSVAARLTLPLPEDV